MLQERLKTMSAEEREAAIQDAKSRLKRKKLYIREIGKPSAEGHHIDLYATWQEDGQTKQKKLGRKGQEVDTAVDEENVNEFHKYGIYDASSCEFLASMVAEGYSIVK